MFQGTYTITITAYKSVAGSDDLAIFGGTNNNVAVLPRQTTPATVVLRDLIGDFGQTDSVPWRPTFLTLSTPSATEVTLTWEDNSFIETGFKVYKKRKSDSDYTLLADLGADSTSYTDVAYDSTNDPVWYRVCACNAVGDSDYITGHMPISRVVVFCEDGHPQYPCGTTEYKFDETHFEN